MFCGVTNPIKEEGKKRPGLYDGTAILKLLESTCSAVGMKCAPSFMKVRQVKRY